MEKPEPFIVVNADPGMEDERSYEFVAKSKERCESAGIAFITAPGPNLYKDLISLPERTPKRADNPAYFTKNAITGKKGRLMQKCTKHYKIAPMRRAVRGHLRGLGKAVSFGVEAWIGFAADEAKRVKPVAKGDPAYIRNRYPLIEMGWDRAKVEGYYLKHNIPKPPRSVCVACFANGLAYFESMFYERPDDWERAVQVDEAIRNNLPNARDEVYVSASLTPLKDLPGLNFLRDKPQGKELRCNSGVCFL